MVKGKPAEIECSQFGDVYFGILNHLGDFWSHRVFRSKREAYDYRDAFWGNDTAQRDQCRRTHKIIPVKLVMTEISTPPTTKGAGE